MSESQPAIWKSKDFDIPVEVMPEAALPGPDGRSYQKVRHDGHESYVPADELAPVPDETPAQGEFVFTFGDKENATLDEWLDHLTTLTDLDGDDLSDLFDNDCD